MPTIAFRKDANMIARYFRHVLSIGVILLASGGTAIKRMGHAADAESTLALPTGALPTPPRLTLPPRDCLSCSGPAACAPCLGTHRGFLYYGTYPWDDDPANGFDDCPGGRCGYPGAALSLSWIRKHQQHSHHAPKPPKRTVGGAPACNMAPHYFQAFEPSTVVDQREGAE